MGAREDRSEVRGGGKKPWRQKGTGRARHGSTRSPIWVGGGKAHGPRNDKDYSQKVNKKMKRVALFSELSKKAKDGEIKVSTRLWLNAKNENGCIGVKGMVMSRRAANAGRAFRFGPKNKNLFLATSQSRKDEGALGRFVECLRHHEPQESFYR